MSSGRIAQHRNYADVMARHEKEVRIKRIMKLFMYFLIIAFLIVLFFIVRRVQQGPAPLKKSESAWINPIEDKTQPFDNNLSS